MSEVVKVLQGILDCKDMPPYKSSHGLKVGSSSSVSSTRRFRASPLNLTPTFPSPNPPCG
ncbi:hypothetical protein A2U01_0108141, partial [Trifolium medium]|nr:hypothetical protein [Trifolium medium]